MLCFVAFNKLIYGGLCYLHSNQFIVTFNNTKNSMKKNFISLVLMIITFSLNAQIWCTPNSVWHFNTSNVTFNSTYTKHTYLYDTLVGVTTFNKIRSQTVGEGVMGSINQSGFFYTSVQGNVILFNSSNISVPNAVDTLMYFGPVGAKWRCQPNGGTSCEHSNIEITETGTLNVQGQNLNWRKINYINYYMYGSASGTGTVTGTDTIFERIGFKHVAFQFSGYCSEFTDVNASSFRCFSDNQLNLNASTVTCDYITGIDEKTKQNIDFKLWPNPGSDIVQLEFYSSNNLEKVIEINIVNMLGEVVRIITIDNHQPNRQITTVNVGDLSRGVYFMNINNSNNKKFIKQ